MMLLLATSTALVPEQTTLVALARRLMSSAPRVVLRFSILCPLTCFLSVVEEVTKPSRSALRWVALAITGMMVSGSFSVRWALLR